MALSIEDPEDMKIITLARASLARAGADEGAAVRDLDGRTYAAAAVRLASFQVSALRLAVAMAASSGAKGLEAAALCTSDGSDALIDLDAVRDLAGPQVPVYLADTSGVPLARQLT